MWHLLRHCLQHRAGAPWCAHPHGVPQRHLHTHRAHTVLRTLPPHPQGVPLTPSPLPPHLSTASIHPIYCNLLQIDAEPVGGGGMLGALAPHSSPCRTGPWPPSPQPPGRCHPAQHTADVTLPSTQQMWHPCVMRGGGVYVGGVDLVGASPHTRHVASRASACHRPWPAIIIAHGLSVDLATSGLG